MDSVNYRIARNVGGGKHWRIWQIELRFAKIFPSNVFKSVNLISHDPVDLTHGSSFEHGCGLTPVVSSTSPALPDPDGPLSEKVPRYRILYVYERVYG